MATAIGGAISQNLQAVQGFAVKALKQEADQTKAAVDRLDDTTRRAGDDFLQDDKPSKNARRGSIVNILV